MPCAYRAMGGFGRRFDSGPESIERRPAAAFPMQSRRQGEFNGNRAGVVGRFLRHAPQAPPAGLNGGIEPDRPIVYTAYFQRRGAGSSGTGKGLCQVARKPEDAPV